MKAGNMRYSTLSVIARACLLACAIPNFTAHAEIVSSVCELNNKNICGATDAPLAASGILTIRGYAFDLSNNDRPIESQAGYVLVRNEDSLITYKIPIQRTEARPDVMADLLPPDFKPEHYGLLKSGFIAQAFTASLPPGYYTIQQTRLQMQKAGLITLTFDTADQRARFTVDEENSPFKLIDATGSITPLKMTRQAGAGITVTGYPALRDANMVLSASFPSINGEMTRTVDFKYRRPTLEVPVSLPLVENFPGMTSRLTPVNPLTNRALDVAVLPLEVETGGSELTKIEGVAAINGKTLDLPRLSAQVGVYPALVVDDGVTAAVSAIKLWVNLPDAPNILLKTERWDPVSKVNVASSTQDAAIKVEEFDIQAKLTNGTKETCNSLSTVKDGVMLSQTASIICAIKFAELPEGMKYNPYASNALRGSIPTIGVNDFEHTIGVLYTNPITKRTNFHAAKTPATKLSVNGRAPVAIAHEFRPDKALSDYYTKNQTLYPNSKFAFVDLAQPRAVGVMNVKAAHREVMSRVIYKDDEFKDTYSSIPESNVAMLMQATEPWAKIPVTVESWYSKAPEYKTSTNLQFVGVPMPPVINIDRGLASHDRAETIVSGVLGIARGQTLNFDKAAMGKWQVTLIDGKTGEAIAEPQLVKDDGTYSISLGILSAGTRLVIAKAQPLDDKSLVTNTSVQSKIYSLVTAAGEQIEATLSARVLSGKAPFVQTLNANVKTTKLLANVKHVQWEYKKPDGVWVRVMRSESIAHTGINYTAILQEAESVDYRAILENKYSGSIFVTEPITLTAFDVPTYKVEAPSVVQKDRPVTLKAIADEGFDAVYSWRIITDGGYTDVQGEKTSEFTFTPTAIKNYAIEVFGRSSTAPNNPAADVKKTVAIKAVNPLASRASIKGPTYVESGKTYTYTAKINDVVPDSSVKSYEIKGYWLLPDGTRVDGTELQFTPKPDDKTLGYYTYVDGIPGDTTLATYPIKVWNYNWPSNWRLRLVAQHTDVPAFVKFYVETPGFDQKSLNGEPLTYTWSLPDGVQRSQGNDIAGTYQISAAGTYQIGLQIADTRGNVTNVITDEFSILPPATVKTAIAITTKYGEAYFAPGTYYVSLKIAEMPRGDSFLRNEMRINGAKVGEFTGSGHYVSFSTAGHYDVSVRTLTKLGNYGEQSLQIEALEAPAPNCEMKVSSTTSGLLYQPSCTVAAGYIKQYLWTYKLDGTEQKTTAKTFVATKAWLAANRISDLRLVVESDLGGVYESMISLEQPSPP